MANNNQLFDKHKTVYVSCHKDTNEVKQLHTLISQADYLTSLDDIEDDCIYITDEIDEKVSDNSTFSAIFILMSRPSEVAKEMSHIIFEPDVKRLMYRIRMMDIGQRKSSETKPASNIEAESPKEEKEILEKDKDKKQQPKENPSSSIKKTTTSTDDKPGERSLPADLIQEKEESVTSQKKSEKSTENTTEVGTSKKKREEKDLTEMTNKQPINDQGPSFLPPMELLESSLYIQQQVMLHQRAANNMTIGVWSPIHRSGVTTFLMNYAMYLGANNCLASVLELPGEEVRMLDELSRFSEMPKQWSSYAQFIQGRKKGEMNEPLPFQWEYKKVYWYPLGVNDHETITWYPDMTRYYIRTMQRYDFTLVDLPTGPMANTTKWSLDLLDEIWIMINDDHQYLYSYKHYIQELLSEYPDLKVFAIFNGEIKGISKPKDVSDILGYPLLTSLPDVNEVVKKHHYTKKPLYQDGSYYKAYEPTFMTLTKHLRGETFKFTSWKTKLKRLLFSQSY